MNIVSSAILRFRATRLEHSTARAQLALNSNDHAAMRTALEGIMNKTLASGASLSTFGGNSTRRSFYTKLEDALGAVRNFGNPPNIPKPDYGVSFSPTTRDNEGNPACQRVRTLPVRMPVPDEVLRNVREDYPGGEGFNEGSYAQSEYWSYVLESKDSAIRNRAETLLNEHPELNPLEISQKAWSETELKAWNPPEAAPEHSRQSEKREAPREALSLHLLKQVLWPTSELPPILSQISN
ncbi:hypothetical protein [Burkholderia latens]|uniref:hypothetical protein n=1 Tax=Burkholderia latens TaxID=488446 RepID=UPI00158A76B3|nr:hypothetical protein [Burkholderia latens]